MIYIHVFSKHSRHEFLHGSPSTSRWRGRDGSRLSSRGMSRAPASWGLLPSHPAGPVLHHTCTMEINIHIYVQYCGIIIVCWGSMFVDFMGYTCPRIYVHTNILQFESNELSYNQLPTKLCPHQLAKF